MATVGPISQYDILRKLARGGMGEVYLARQTGIAGFAKEVVIKRIHSNFSEDPQFVGMFLQEARIAALLDHPNIVQIYELGKQGDDYFIVMEYIRGLSLSRLMKVAQGAMPLPIAIQVAAGVAAGLQFAHEHKDANQELLHLVHRDISPPNILLSTSGSVKITDFGIAKIRQSVTQTQVGVIKGKWSYISPEQARGESATPQSDIYSLGLVLYEMTTGVRAYPPGNDKSLLRAVANGQVPPPELHMTNYPDDLRAVLMRAIEPDRKIRYHECQELQEDLLSLLVSRQIVTSPAKLGQYLAQFVDEPVMDEPAQQYSPPPGQRELEPDEVLAVAPLSELDLPVATVNILPSAIPRRPQPVIPRKPEPFTSGGVREPFTSGGVREPFTSGGVQEPPALAVEVVDPEPPVPQLPDLDEFDDDVETIMLDRAAQHVGLAKMDDVTITDPSTGSEVEPAVVVPVASRATDLSLLQGMATFEPDSSVEGWDSELAARGVPPPAVEPASGSLTGAAGEVSVAIQRAPSILPWVLVLAVLAVAGTIGTWILLGYQNNARTPAAQPPRTTPPDLPDAAHDRDPRQAALDSQTRSPADGPGAATAATVVHRPVPQRSRSRHRPRPIRVESIPVEENDTVEKNDTATLLLTTNPITQVFLSGRDVGRTPLRLEVARGQVTLVLKNASLGIHTVRQVRISSDSVSTRFVLGRGILGFKLPEGRKVLLDGKSLGLTPLSPLVVYEGQHDVTMLTERQRKQQTVSVRPGKTTWVSFPD